MTAPALTPRPGRRPTRRPGSRAARMALPRAIDALKHLATEYGVCVRPVALRRTDLATGADRGHRPALRRHPRGQVPAVRQAGQAAPRRRRSARAGTAPTNPSPAPTRPPTSSGR